MPRLCGPHLLNNISKLQMVQRRAARFVMNDIHEYMLNQLGWPMLKQ